jgi:hypothetical protein
MSEKKHVSFTGEPPLIHHVDTYIVNHDTIHNDSFTDSSNYNDDALENGDDDDDDDFWSTPRIGVRIHDAHDFDRQHDTPNEGRDVPPCFKKPRRTLFSSPVVAMVTPHRPNDSDSNKENMESVIDTTEGMNTSSKVHNVGYVDNENHETTEECEKIEEDTKWWDDACAFIEDKEVDSPCNQHLQAWKQSVEKHESAQNHLGNVLDESKSALDDNITQLFTHVVAPIHQKSHQSAIQIQLQLGSLLTSNHQRRRQLINGLEQSNHQWQQHYNNLVGKVLHPSVERDSTTNEHGSKQAASVETEATKAESEADPDWQAMVTMYEACGPHIEAFLQGSDRLQEAEEKLAQALDDIHQQLQDATQALLQAVVDIHKNITPTFENKRDELQQLLAYNAQRRQQAQLELEESVKRTQGILSSLMSRVFQHS